MQNESIRSANRTKYLFKDALLRLLETESFAYISVRDIVETAEFTRTTFYNHYIDKFDLLDDVTQDFLDRFADALQTSFQKYYPTNKMLMTKTDIIIFDFIYHNKNKYNLLLNKQKDFLPNYSRKLSEAVLDRLIDIWSSEVDMTDPSFKAYTKIFRYVLMGTIGGWMAEDFSTDPETTTQEFVDYYNFKFDKINKHS
ncbi:TetR/AcrR family transcriptional regulator [Trichococcus shcherbakoviae]|jgi:AcrR family transcriptional regulator|uniref:TetR/AcrR family transcriptional regulator n=1 Tax=Trichococcus shcherbakoviae TaxID=2094020 RepID=UPI0029F58819|nr:TetR/AcrR family transcriptional regulator [Trichococcus shcherbakoviae]